MEGKHYHISHMDKETKEKNIAFRKEIQENGELLVGRSGWRGEYLVEVWTWKDKIYELWDNMDLGIMSEVIEFDKEEYLNDQTISNNS